MSDYIGAECLICKEKFTADDEIVVCPECGTPYHRECYKKEGRCVNNELHEKNGSWKHSDAANQSNIGVVKCKNCGVSNPENGIFCSNCGKSLINDFNYEKRSPFGAEQVGAGGIPPFFQQTLDQMSGERITEETEIDEIKVSQYNKYIKSNNLYFLPQFIRFSKTGKKVSFNIAAALVPELYFFLRKMTGTGFIVLFLMTIFSIFNLSTYFLDPEIALSIPQIANYINKILSPGTLKLLSAISFIGVFSVRILCGIFANYLYFKKAKKLINKVNNMDITESQKSETLVKKGGISKAVIYIYISLVLIFYIAVYFIV